MIRSPHGSIDVPNTPLAEFVLAKAAGRGRRPALIEADTGRTIAYAELPHLVDRVAGSLAKLGIAKGDVCAIFAANTPEYVIAVLAVARLGAVMTPASPLYTTADLAKQLQDSGARLLFTSSSLAASWQPALEGTAVEQVVTFDDASGPAGRYGLRPFATLTSAEVQAPPVLVEPGDLVALPYSSGTTGLPKGVMLTHRNLVANILQIDAAGHYRHDEDVTIAFLPLFHIYGLTAIALLGLWSGATLVIMAKFDLEPYLALVERYRATMLHVVPPVVLALAKHPAVAARDLSSLRKLFSGAAPLGADIIEQCTRRLGCMLQQGYGLTETSPAAVITSDDPGKIKAGSVGVPVASTECRVVDPETGHDVPAGSNGEIWIRGPQVMQGYLKRPDDTRAVLDEDGWFRSGDLGYVDADGQLFIVDQLKELIKYKGLQVPPAELEAVLLSHPAVADAAVVPFADAEAGEIPHAFVVLKGEATAEALMRYVAERVASYKKVRRLEFVAAIPKSPSGKILRRLLKHRP